MKNFVRLRALKCGGLRRGRKIPTDRINILFCLDCLRCIRIFLISKNLKKLWRSAISWSRHEGRSQYVVRCSRNITFQKEWWLYVATDLRFVCTLLFLRRFFMQNKIQNVKSVMDSGNCTRKSQLVCCALCARYGFTDENVIGVARSRREVGQWDFGHGWSWKLHCWDELRMFQPPGSDHYWERLLFSTGLTLDIFSLINAVSSF